MNDEIIAEIRAVRHRISEEFGHNPQRYIDYLKSQNCKYIRQTELYRRISEYKTESLQTDYIHTDNLTAYQLKTV